MSKGIKTISISGLIKELKDIQKEYGNLAVIHQSDPEGNSFGTLTKESMYVDGNMLFLHPFEENIFDY